MLETARAPCRHHTCRAGSSSASRRKRGQLLRLHCRQERHRRTNRYVFGCSLALCCTRLWLSSLDAEDSHAQPSNDAQRSIKDEPADGASSNRDLDYVVEEIEAPLGFADVFARFQAPLPDEDVVRASYIPGRMYTTDQRSYPLQKPDMATADKGEVIYSDDDMPSEGDEDAAPKLSKRKQRKANRLSVAELKRLVKKPEVVDWVDVSATDPKLLVQLKSHRNTIPIPPHWSQKRDYLQGKRGIEKPAFQLPSRSFCYECCVGLGRCTDPSRHRLHRGHWDRDPTRCHQRKRGGPITQSQDEGARAAEDGQD